MAKNLGKRRGQVLIMVTLALLMLCGMLGLVVDLGWSYFTKKSAQAAADAGALAAVKAAMDDAVDISSYTCGGNGAECLMVPTPCPNLPGNLQSACMYAQQHGFTTGGRQLVTVQAWDRTPNPTVVENCGQGGASVAHPPTADPPCVDTFYWVTVRVTERIPQLFSSVFGNTEGVVSARATAAVAKSVTPASLILINRENDPWTDDTGKIYTGNNLYVGGTPQVIVPGGIIMASGAGGPAKQDAWAGYIAGSGTVESPAGTYIRDNGDYYISGGGSWTITPENQPDNEIFWDPYEGLAQPPVTTTQLPWIPVPTGNLGSLKNTVCKTGCPSGNYFATGIPKGCNNCAEVATGEQIIINTNLEFNGGGFGDFNFFGGLNIGQAEVTFGPGRYVMAGTLNENIPLLNTDNKAKIIGGNGSDAGRLFILTDSQYPGLETQLANIPNAREWAGPNKNTLVFSKSSIKSGNNAGSSTELYSLSKDIGNTVPELAPYQGFLLWQDRRNSYVHYKDDNKYVDDGVDGDKYTLNDPVYNYDSKGNGYPSLGSTSPQLELWATPFAHFDGTIYQPRGAWTKLQASGNYNGPLRIVSGALRTQGSGHRRLTGPAIQTIVYGTALVE